MQPEKNQLVFNDLISNLSKTKEKKVEDEEVIVPKIEFHSLSDEEENFVKTFLKYVKNEQINLRSVDGVEKELNDLLNKRLGIIVTIWINFICQTWLLKGFGIGGIISSIIGVLCLVGLISTGLKEYKTRKLLKEKKEKSAIMFEGFLDMLNFKNLNFDSLKEINENIENSRLNLDVSKEKEKEINRTLSVIRDNLDKKEQIESLINLLKLDIKVE